MLPKQGREKYQFGRVREYIMTWYAAPTVWDGFLAKRSVWASQVMRWDSLTLELCVHWQYCCRTSTNQIAHHRYVFLLWMTYFYIFKLELNRCLSKRNRKNKFPAHGETVWLPVVDNVRSRSFVPFLFHAINFVTSQTLFFSEQS